MIHTPLQRPSGRPFGCPSGRRPWATLRLACALAWAVNASAQPLQADPPADSDFARQVLEAVNLHRAQQQLTPWQADAALAEIAAGHSQAMARHGALSHAGFQARFERTQRRVCVENLAARYRQAERLVAGWQASPGHGENLLDARVQQVGVASVGGYVTLLACSAARAPAR